MLKNLFQKLAVATAGVALSCAVVGAKPAEAAQFDFSYSGDGVEASGILTTTDLDPSTNTYTVTGISGERNGVLISGLLPPNTFPSDVLPNNNLLFQSSPFLDIGGFSYSAGSRYYNPYFSSSLSSYLEFANLPGTTEVGNNLPTSIAFSLQPTQSVPEPSAINFNVVIAGSALWLVKRKLSASRKTKV